MREGYAPLALTDWLRAATPLGLGGSGVAGGQCVERADGQARAAPCQGGCRTTGPCLKRAVAGGRCAALPHAGWEFFLCRFSFMFLFLKAELKKRKCPKRKILSLARVRVKSEREIYIELYLYNSFYFVVIQK